LILIKYIPIIVPSHDLETVLKWFNLFCNHWIEFVGNNLLLFATKRGKSNKYIIKKKTFNTVYHNNSIITNLKLSNRIWYNICIILNIKLETSFYFTM